MMYSTGQAENIAGLPGRERQRASQGSPGGRRSQCGHRESLEHGVWAGADGCRQAVIHREHERKTTGEEITCVKR